MNLIIKNFIFISALTTFSSLATDPRMQQYAPSSSIQAQASFSAYNGLPSSFAHLGANFAYGSPQMGPIYGPSVSTRIPSQYQSSSYRPGAAVVLGEVSEDAQMLSAYMQTMSSFRMDIYPRYYPSQVQPQFLFGPYERYPRVSTSVHRQ